jgi:alanyl-tRNA synthetase
VASKDRTNGEWLVVAERGATATFDAGRWLKAAAAAHRGRGGGRVEHAEGRFPADADWPVLGLVR